MDRRLRLGCLLPLLLWILIVLGSAWIAEYWWTKLKLLPVSPAVAVELGVSPAYFPPVPDSVTKWCPRCRFINEGSLEAAYCRHCGTAMLDRFCLVCVEPLFGPELTHLTTMLRGGPKVL